MTNENRLTGSMDYVLLMLLVVSLCVNIFCSFRLRADRRLLSAYIRQLADVKPLSSAAVAEISSSDAPSIGPSNAMVTIVVFSDFQCVYCRRFAATLSQLENSEGNEFRIVFRELPLSIHPYARKEAELGSCVARQSSTAFWSLYRYMYTQNGTGNDTMANALQFINSRPEVNVATLRSCIHDHEAANQVDHDLQLARKYNIDSTPTVFLNGVRLADTMREPHILAELIREKGHHS